MGVGRECGGELRQKEIHHCGTDDRQHQSEVLAGGGTDGGEDVGPLIALLHEAGRTLQFSNRESVFILKSSKRTGISKAAYARHRGVRPCTLSNWIKRNKIGGAALLPDGRIVVAEADRQLASTVDPVRRQASRAQVRTAPPRPKRRL